MGLILSIFFLLVAISTLIVYLLVKRYLIEGFEHSYYLSIFAFTNVVVASISMLFMLVNYVLIQLVG